MREHGCAVRDRNLQQHASKQMQRGSLGAKSNMQSAVTNGAASRAHRILDVFESLRGLKSLRGCANDYRLATND
jgi:hypothetical protein